MKTYDIIYMDPPWWYQGQSMTGPKKQATSHLDMHYPQMKDNELMDMPIYDMLNDNALVYMWVGSPILHRAMKIAEHWGLSYATIAFVWDKQITNPGFYTMSQHEICLVFKKGKIPQPRGIRNAKQLISEKRREHSRKPDEVRTRIEAMHPTQSKLELFARTTSKGWDVWGNEVNKF